MNFWLHACSVTLFLNFCFLTLSLSLPCVTLFHNLFFFLLLLWWPALFVLSITEPVCSNTDSNIFYCQPLMLPQVVNYQSSTKLHYNCHLAFFLFFWPRNCYSIKMGTHHLTCHRLSLMLYLTHKITSGTGKPVSVCKTVTENCSPADIFSALMCFSHFIYHLWCLQTVLWSSHRVNLLGFIWKWDFNRENKPRQV